MTDEIKRPLKEGEDPEPDGGPKGGFPRQQALKEGEDPEPDGGPKGGFPRQQPLNGG